MQKIINLNIRGYQIKLKMKPGIFSQNGLDSGTKLLIDNLKINNNTLIADLGSGSGIVGFIAAKLNPDGHIHLLDDHLRSADLAKENVGLNNLRNVEVYLSDLFSAVEGRTYHQIFSNPPQQMGNEFLREILEQSYKHLKPGGEFYLVVKKNLKNVIERLLNNFFQNTEIIAQGKEHIVIKAKK